MERLILPTIFVTFTRKNKTFFRFFFIFLSIDRKRILPTLELTNVFWLRTTKKGVARRVIQSLFLRLSDSPTYQHVDLVTLFRKRWLFPDEMKIGFM